MAFNNLSLGTFWKFWKTPPEGIDVPVPSTDNEYGPEVVIKEGSVLVPLELHVGFKTDGGEAITVRIRVYYSDGSYVEDTASVMNVAPFTWYLVAKWGACSWDTPDPLASGSSLNWTAKDGVYITKITASAQTNSYGSTAIVRVAGIGFGA